MYWLVLRRLLFAVILLVRVMPAQESPAIRVQVQEVHVDAEVVSKDGRIISGLTQKDFRVFDEGQEQRLVSFGSQEQALDIILLFDVSGSMRKAVQKIAISAQKAMDELRDGDRVSIMTFADQTRIVCPFTSKLDLIEHEIQGILKEPFRSHNTYLQQGIDESCKVFLRDQGTNRRRAILVITDNIGKRTRREMSVIYNLWEADTVVCGLIVPDPTYPVRRAIVAVLAPYALASVRGMDHIAEQTGGDTVRVDVPDTAFPEMMHRLRSRYSLYYPTPEGKSGSIRNIKVELAPDSQDRYPDARVYARRGYRLEGDH